MTEAIRILEREEMRLFEHLKSDLKQKMRLRIHKKILRLQIAIKKLKEPSTFKAEDIAESQKAYSDKITHCKRCGIEKHISIYRDIMDYDDVLRHENCISCYTYLACDKVLEFTYPPKTDKITYEDLFETDWLKKFKKDVKEAGNVIKENIALWKLNDKLFNANGKLEADLKRYDDIAKAAKKLGENPINITIDEYKKAIRIMEEAKDLETRCGYPDALDRIFKILGSYDKTEVSRLTKQIDTLKILEDIYTKAKAKDKDTALTSLLGFIRVSM